MSSLSRVARRLAEDAAARNLLAVHEGRAYKTYRARESAKTRLDQRARAWNWALIALSTATTIASIGILSDTAMYGENGDLLLVALAVLSLVASLGITNMNYASRSRDMFLNYRKLQRLSVKMERLRKQERPLITLERADILLAEYQDILDETENHTRADYVGHFSSDLPKTDPFFLSDEDALKVHKRALRRQKSVTLAPYVTMCLPILLMVPLSLALWP